MAEHLENEVKRPKFKKLITNEMKNLFIFFIFLVLKSQPLYSKEKPISKDEKQKYLKTELYYNYSKKTDTLETYSYYLKDGKKILHGEYVKIENVKNKNDNVSIIRIARYKDGKLKSSSNLLGLPSLKKHK